MKKASENVIAEYEVKAAEISPELDDAKGRNVTMAEKVRKAEGMNSLLEVEKHTLEE